MSEPVGGVRPPSVPPGPSTPATDRPQRPLDLQAEGKAAIGRLAGDDQRAGMLGSGKATPSLSLTGERPAVFESQAGEAERYQEVFGRKDVGSMGTVYLDLGKPLVVREDGFRLGVVVDAAGAKGPSVMGSSFLGLSGNLAVKVSRPEPEWGVNQYLAVGPVVGLDAVSSEATFTVRMFGVGGHLESGVAIPVGRDTATVELGAYANVMSDRQEAGVMLRVR